jgi:hypothetical protein
LGEKLPKEDRPAFKHIRPKALSDGKDAGFTVEQLKDAAVHARVGQTEKYIVGVTAVQSPLRLALPTRKRET